MTESQVSQVARPTTPPPEAGDLTQDGARTQPRELAAAVAVPVLLLLLSVCVVIASAELGYWTPIGPGPGFLPLWLAVLLGAMSAVWLAQRLRARPAPPEPAEVAGISEDRAVEPHDEPLRLKQVFLVLGSLTAVTALLEVLGFQLAMLLFLLFQLKVLARRGWVLTLTLSALGSFGVYTVFAGLLSVHLPTSSIPLLRSMGF
ncbi:tripartite tricarboxylate transporter TctB family protein [Pseudonocardia zijingensis]|uniref:DUF1468 domain-containing protein n=1 Tax=Pseudonocardia zijingensis TaxID=153376 RepID=A0ABP4AHI6_9PSEU